jgi:hypothetical protein
VSRLTVLSSAFADGLADTEGFDEAFG